MFGRNNPAELHTWVEARLSDYIDNQLPTAERTQLEQHVDECTQCRASLESMRWTIALVKQAPVPASKKSFTLAVPVRRVQPSFAFAFARLATAVATLVLVAVIGVDLITQFGGTTSAPAPAMAPMVEKVGAPTQAIALAPTKAPEPTSSPKLNEASRQADASSAAPVPPVPANVPPAAPTQAPAPSSFSSEVSPTKSVLDSAKSPSATQPAARQAVGSGAAVTATVAAPTASVAPTQTATSVPPTATLIPTNTPTVILTPQPVAQTEEFFPPLRLAEIVLLFTIIFFGTLAILLWRR